MIWLFLADSPQTARYLNNEERRLLVARLQRQVGFHEEFDRKDAMLAFKDWKVWMFAAGQFSVNSMLYSYSVFLPSIISGNYHYDAFLIKDFNETDEMFPLGLGKWTSPQAQALTVPCYVLGAISYLVVAKLSDMHQQRGIYQITFAAICIIGYGISIAEVSSGVHYFATLLISLGLFVAVGIPLAWLPSNNPRYGKRTTASGIQIMVCNCSGIVAPFVSLPIQLLFFRLRVLTLG